MEGGSLYLTADDARLKWMKDVVSSALGTTSAQWDSFFPKFKDNLARFLNKGAADAALLIYADISSEVPVAEAPKELEESKEPAEVAAAEADANAAAQSNQVRCPL
jgi:hypothetical protein